MKRIFKMWITVLAAVLLGFGLQSCTGMADIVYQTNYSISIATNSIGSNSFETISQVKKKSQIETTVVRNLEYYYRVSTVTNFEVNMERVGSETNSFDYTNSSALTNYLTNLIKQDEKIEEAEEEASEESEGKDTVSEKGGELNEDISVSFLGLTNQQQVGTNVVVNGLTSGEVSAVYAGVNGGEFRKMSGVNPWFGTFNFDDKHIATIQIFALNEDNNSSATNQIIVYADSANQETDEDNSLRVVDGEESDQEAPVLNMDFSGSTVENGSLIRTGVVTISGSSSDEAGIEGIYVRIYEREIVTNGGVVTTNLVSVTDDAGNVITEYDQFVKVGVDENGNWTMPYVDLDTGDYVVQIYSQDQSYNTSETNEVGFSVDLTPTAGEIWVNQYGSQYTTNRTIQISNTFEYGSIKIAEEGTDLDSVAWLDCSETDVIEYLLSEGYGEKTITYVTRTTDLDGGVYETNTITIELTGKVEEFDFSELRLNGFVNVNGNGVPVFTNSQILEIEGESGVVYKYTTDGSDPSTSQTAVVTAPGDGFEIVLGEGTTNQIKVVKEKTGWTDSDLASQTYIITGRVVAPVFSLAGGNYDTSIDIGISTETSGAVIEYQTNNAGWTTYSEPIHVSISGEQKTINIEAKAKKTNWAESGTSSASYIVQGVVGTINGVVKQAQADGNHSPLNGVLVRIYDVDGTFLEESTTGSDGSYEFDVRTGDGYQVNYSKEGFVTVNYNDVTVEYNAFTYLETVLQVVDPGPTGPTTGAVSGQIKSATSGQGLSGVTLKFRKGMNTESGQVVYQMNTGNNGNFDTGSVLSPGNYTVEVVESGYISTYFSVVVIAGETISGQSIQIRPEMPEGQISFVLSWGKNPRDLDSHLTGPTIDKYGQRFHIAYYRRALRQDGSYSWRYGDDDIAHLDRDDVNSYGPETITILEQEPGRYSYWVHRYSGSGNFTTSGAKVKMYVGATLIKTFYPPTGQAGDIWLVCDVNGSEVTPVQQYINTWTIRPVRSDEPHEWTTEYEEIGTMMEDLPSKE